MAVPADCAPIRRAIPVGVAAQFLAILMTIAAAAPVLAADGKVKEIAVAARTLQFIEGLPSGALQLAAVYDEGDAASAEQCKAVVETVGQGLMVANRTLAGRLVPVTSLGGIDGANLVFVCQGTAAHQAAIAAAVQSRSLLSISTDFACVNAANCVMGLKAEPRVEVVISRRAAAASNLKFAQALKLFVTEVE